MKTTMSGSTFLYFAYGSNLLKQRLLLNNPSAVFVTIAKLQDYKLTFESIMNPTFTRWKGAAASIVEEKNSSVWGSVWRLDDIHRESLDRQEGCYNAFDVTVISPEKETLTCRTYQMKKTTSAESGRHIDHRPSPHYKDVIVRGAKQQRLPDEYIKFLECIEDNGYEGEIEVYSQVLKSLSSEAT